MSQCLSFLASVSTVVSIVFGVSVYGSVSVSVDVSVSVVFGVSVYGSVSVCVCRCLSVWTVLVSVSTVVSVDVSVSVVFGVSVYSSVCVSVDVSESVSVCDWSGLDSGNTHPLGTLCLLLL